MLSIWKCIQYTSRSFSSNSPVITFGCCPPLWNAGKWRVVEFVVRQLIFFCIKTLSIVRYLGYNFGCWRWNANECSCSFKKKCCVNSVREYRVSYGYNPIKLFYCGSESMAKVSDDSLLVEVEVNPFWISISEKDFGITFWQRLKNDFMN